MDIPELDFTIWWRPHRAWGYLVNIVSMPEDDQILGFFQSFADVPGASEYPYFDRDRPHREFEVTVEAFLSLCRRANTLSYQFAELRPFERFGGSFFGIRLERGFQEFAIKWHGTFDDLQDEHIKDLYRQIQHIAGEPYPSDAK